MLILTDIKQAIVEKIQTACYPVGLKVSPWERVSINRDIEADTRPLNDRRKFINCPFIQVSLIAVRPWQEHWRGSTVYYNTPDIHNHPDLEINAGDFFTDDDVIQAKILLNGGSKPPKWRNRYEGVVPARYVFELRIFSDKEEEVDLVVLQTLQQFGGISNIGSLIVKRRRDSDLSLQYDETFTIECGESRKIEPTSSEPYYQFNQDLTVFAYYEQNTQAVREYTLTDIVDSTDNEP